MKKVLVLLVAIFSLSSYVTFAQDVKKDSTAVENKAPQSEFVKMDATQLPPLVMNALAKAHEGASIKEAYVAERETGKVFKVIVTSKEEQETTVLLNEKGEQVNE